MLINSMITNHLIPDGFKEIQVPNGSQRGV